ncbi:pentapeptide MXKDX repeat protein [Rhizosaccharibacter radicis]|uniref:Pentapeptide MXKDX repeat protein n=1 Tax=Rhizosaccharibacter radicis TaxID=2782605 RepID=A0ABT1VTS7_9PROT|nr:pentapeptide MXKDX repeat protein [Acetobacteraceae bacterium KSS12]
MIITRFRGAILASCLIATGLAPAALAQDSMQKPGDTMSHDSMGKNGMSHDAMQHAPMSHNGMQHDNMGHPGMTRNGMTHDSMSHGHTDGAMAPDGDSSHSLPPR